MSRIGISLVAAVAAGMSIIVGAGCEPPDDGPSNPDAGATADADASPDGSASPDASAPGDSGGVDADGGPPPVTGEKFRNPDEFEPDGDGVFRLRMKPAAINIAGKRYCARTFNGAFPDPTLRIHPSKHPRRVRVDVINEFRTPAIRNIGHGDHDFNSTNLHTHGLHVRPDKTADGRFLGDNVYVHVEPREKASFRFDIDEAGRHDEGTFWYHPHNHGAVAIQVGSGMAGALIIEGPTDKLAGVCDAEERVFLMTHVPFDRARPLDDREPCTESNLSIDDFATIAAPPSQTLVNGLLEPVITAPPGQVERWRFVHAGVNQELTISLRPAAGGDCHTTVAVPIPVQQIAFDGLTLPQKRAASAVLMTPGNRLDAMVETPKVPGTYCVVANFTPFGPMGVPGTPQQHVLATLRVDASAGKPTGGMPADKDLARVAPPTLDCGKPISFVQDVTYGQLSDANGNPCEGLHPTGVSNIDCKTFDHDRVRRLVLNRTEEWRVRSGAGPHSVHIHTNPFTVCEEGGKPVAPYWRDTVFIDERNPVQFRTKYADFTGKIVQHCHKLDHEDMGMMEAMEIEDCD